MNLLIDRLPDFVKIDGRACRINSDFTVGILFELAMQDPSLSDEEKVEKALSLYYPDIPSNIRAAMDNLLWFYGCGRDVLESKKGGGEHKSSKKAYDFEQDDEYIFAAFVEHYGIDLNTVGDLHWWKFRALFVGLNSECELCKIMGYRTADTKGMPKKQKQFYERMKQQYALRNNVNAAAALTLAERNQRMKDYVTQRYEEAAQK